MSQFDTTPELVALRDDIVRKENDSLLELAERTGGNSSEGMAGYIELARFYNGGTNQWKKKPEEDRSFKTFNYMFSTVENFESMMTDELPQIDIPADPADDDAEQDRADGAERILNKIIEDNDPELFYCDLSKCMSGYGDGFIYGPWYDKDKKKICFSAIENPAAVSIGWSDDKWIKKDWAIYRCRISLESANKKYGGYFKSLGKEIKDDATGVTEYWNNDVAPTQTGKFKFVKQIHYWSDTEYVSIVNDEIVEYVTHNWGFVPMQHIPNIKRLGRPWGMSDIEQAMDAQVDYNEMTCNEADVIKVVAFPKYVGVNVEEEVKSWRSGITQIFLVGPDADIKPIQSGGTPYPIKDYMDGSLQRIYDLTGMTEIAYGRGLASNVSGRAVNVAMQVTVNKLKKKKKRIKKALKELFSNCLKLSELYFPDSKKIIQGKYRVDIYWGEGMVRNVVDELNKLNAGVQSKYTTMKNLSTASPKDEFKLMEMEKINEAKLMAKIQQLMAPPTPPISGGEMPTLNESQNQGGEQPMAMKGRGIPSVSPENNARLGGGNG